MKGRQITLQLEAAIHELEEVGQQLNYQDQKEFTEKIKPYKKLAQSAVKDFKYCSEEYSDTLPHLLEAEENREKINLSQALILPEEFEIETRKAHLETFENLQKDVEDLHDLFAEFSQQVHVSFSIQ